VKEDKKRKAQVHVRNGNNANEMMSQSPYSKESTQLMKPLFPCQRGAGEDI
jgi:hypothetical protein